MCDGLVTGRGREGTWQALWQKCRICCTAYDAGYMRLNFVWREHGGLIEQEREEPNCDDAEVWFASRMK